MKLGLVLSGGFSKGAYQAGFLKAFEENFGRRMTVCAAGASIGMLNAYAFCAGKTEKLLQIWREINFTSLGQLTKSAWRDMFISKTIKRLAEEGDRLLIPLYSPICYLPAAHMEYFKLLGYYTPKWYPYMRGAINFPVLSGKPTVHRIQFTLDGGAVDNIPILPLVEKEKPDLVLVIHFVSQFSPRKHIVKYGVPIIDYDIALNHKLCQSSFDFRAETLHSMLEEGYRYGVEICNVLNSGTLRDVLENAAIKRQKESYARKKAAVVDTWVYRLNKATYPIWAYSRGIYRDLTQNAKEEGD